jgi:hypothetical protein
MMVMVVAAMSPDGAHNAHDPQSDERVAQSLHGRLQRKSERVSECVCVCVCEREREPITRFQWLFQRFQFCHFLQ